MCLRQVDGATTSAEGDRILISAYDTPPTTPHMLSCYIYTLNIYILYALYCISSGCDEFAAGVG